MDSFKDKSRYESGSHRGSTEMRPAVAGEGPSNVRPSQEGSRGDSSSIDHVEKVPATPAKLSKRRRMRNHCARFWPWYLLANIIFLAIFLPLLFTKIIPAIVQGIVNKQELPVFGGAYIAISPTQLNISLDTQLDTPLPATIEQMEVHLYNHDTPNFSPFVNLTFPEIHTNHKTNVSIKDQTATVANHSELVKFFGNVFDNEVVSIGNRANVKVHLGALQMKAHLEKTVEIPALNKLKNFGIIDIQLVLPPLENGTNIKGHVNLPNWGRLALGLGNLTLNIFSHQSDIKLGIIDIPNVNLPHGNNSFSFTGQLDIGYALQNIGPILDSQADPLSRGAISLGTTGNATMMNGEHLRYVEEVLNNRRIFSEMPVITLASQILGGLLTNGNGDGPPLLDVLGDMVGNKTFVEEVLHKFNSTGALTGLNATKSGGKPNHKRRSLPMALNLFKMSMKMRKH
ncbi:uncharacterized protein E0L32_007709 [Thyridium curvatum]|uniref:Uncharacterized protein n=1 Tax=Thyridium curvatum TaxID=1093900 RepID=A0A507B3L9_9PEZI|nr:uncharacterized protein E0L32_007709 [Thyridium curvatum]TPX11498.1 hypothetical protein E0L32_007709 [Thyridium curvatum]